MIEDGRGLRSPVYFRFILTVDNRTAERFARLDGRLVERVLRDAVQKTFRGAGRGLQGVFAVHQHGGEDRPAHPHVHALLSPRLESGSPTHISPRRIERVKERWENEVLRGLERQEKRIERARATRAPLGPMPVRDRGPERPPLPTSRRPRSLGPLGLMFMRTRKARRLARPGHGWLGSWLHPRRRLDAFARDPERAARQSAFRLVSSAMPGPIRDALWLVRGLRGLGLRQR